MIETKYYRKKNLIMGPDGIKEYPSISQAKKASWALQKENGGLGCGILKVLNSLEKLPDFLLTAGKHLTTGALQNRKKLTS